MNPFDQPNLVNKSIKSSKNLSFDEAFLDLQQEDPQAIEGEKDFTNHRVLILVMFLGFIFLIGQIFRLQVIKGEEYRSLAEGNKLRVQYVLAPRGLIIDAFGKIIAGNIPKFELDIFSPDLPKDPQEYELFKKSLSQVFGKTEAEIQDSLNALNRDSLELQLLFSNIEKDQALVLISRKQEFPGLIVQNTSIRDYKDPLQFAHLTGYSGKITSEELEANSQENYLFNDNIGKTGLEVYYEKYLRGIPGRKQTEVDAKGNFKKVLAEVPATPGNNLLLNIDYDLQAAIYKSLINILKRGSAKRAAAVATDPKTGKVLALISLPSFDSNWFAQGITTDQYNSLINNPNIPLLNRVVAGTYPPGSTVKPMLAGAALAEGVVKPETKILDDGVIRVGVYTFYGYRREGLGLMDIYSAIARSSDIYFYTIGGGNPKTNISGLGPDKIASWYRKFNLGSVLGIDLPHEKTGLVPDEAWKKEIKNEPWYLGNTYHVSIGQGDLLATPLQVNSWTATIANGGKIMRPYIVNKVVSNNGKTVFTQEPKVLSENFLDPQIVKIVQDGMRQTITEGSAQYLNALTLPVSGKTGTAQFDAKNLDRTHAWFTSYAPSNDPQIALTILVESGGEGSGVAVPVARDVYQWWADNRWQKK